MINNLLYQYHSNTLYIFYSLVRIYEALDILVRHKRINSEIADEVKTFLKSNPASIPLIAKTESDERTSKINEVINCSLVVLPP